MSMPEQDFFIPPNVSVNTDGTIDQADWPEVMRIRNDLTRWIMTFTGMGMPPIKYIEQSGPNQAGNTILDFRLLQRLIQYTIYDKEACSRQGYWDQRSSLIDFLRPNKQNVNEFNMGRIRKVLPNGDIRDIDAIFSEGLAFTARNIEFWDEWSIAETLRFRCPDPTWYDPVQQSVSWTIETINGLLFYSATYPRHLVFPTNMIFAASALSGSEDITYGGTWFGYPVITITGPLNGFSIINTVLDIKIALNYEIAVGEVVTINTAYDNKSIVNQLGTNLIGTKTLDSDLNFYLAPSPIAPDGVNTIEIRGTHADSNLTEVLLTYYTRHIGI